MEEELPFQFPSPNQELLPQDHGIKGALLKNQEQQRVAIAAGLAFLWTCLALLAQFSGVLDEFEEPSLDYRQKLASFSMPPSDQLALVAIDDIPADHPWPWSRLDYTLMLRSVIDYVPNSVVFEMNLNDRDTQQTEFDSTFAGIVNRANSVVFSAKLVATGKEDPLPANSTPLHYEGNIHGVGHFHSAIWPLETFAGSSPVGINNIQPEGNGIRLRRIPMVFMLKDTMVPSLTLQASAQILGADLNVTQVQLGRAIFLRRTDGKLLRTIPIDTEGRMRIRYRPGATTSWQSSFNNIVLFADQLQKGQKPDQDLRALRKRQIWVGRTDPAVLEKFETPVGQLSRVEAQIQAERTILNQDYVRPLPPLVLALFYFIVGVGGAAMMIRLGVFHTTACLVLLLSFWIEAALTFFQLYNIILPFMSFGLLMIGTYVVGMLARYWDLDPETAS